MTNVHIPYLERFTIEAMAMSLVNATFGKDAVHEPCIIDIHYLAEFQLNATIDYHRLSTDDTILGLSVLRDGKVNTFGPRGGNRITTIVIHHWDDPAKNPSFDGTVGWFVSGRGRNSAHYVVEAGRVTRLVVESDTAWHAGNWPVNQTSIGIECNPRASEADKQTIAALIRDIQSRHGRLRIIGHKDASSTACPGRYYPPNTVLGPYLGANNGVQAAPKPPAASAPGGSVDELARAVLAGRYGNGEERKRRLGARYAEVQTRVNELIAGKTPAPSAPNLDALANAVLRGEYGNGAERRRRLGSLYQPVQDLVNRKLGIH